MHTSKHALLHVVSGPVGLADSFMAHPSVATHTESAEVHFVGDGGDEEEDKSIVLDDLDDLDDTELHIYGNYNKNGRIIT